MKLGVALRLGRVSNLPTVLTNVLAALVLSGASFTAGIYLLTSLAMTLAYVGGMYLNDAFDREIDARMRPERPIPAGEASASTVFALGFGMLGLALACTALVVFGSGVSQGASAPAALGSAVLLVLTIVFYDLYHKHNPYSPLVMGACRVLVYTTAALCLAPAPPKAALLWGALALLSYLIGLSYAAKQESLGRIERAWPLLFLALPFASAAAVHDLPSLALFLLFLCSTAYALAHLFGRRRKIPKAVGHFIASISLLDATLVAIAGEPLLGAACVLAFALTLLLQRVVPGT